MRTVTARRIVAASLLATLLSAPPASAQSSAEKPAGAKAKPDVDPRWLERLDAVDRALLDDLVGFAPPPLPDSITWVGSDAMTWEDLRGKVVVLHSFSGHTSAGRKVPARLAKSLDGVGADDVRIVLLQTPDGAKALQRYLERRPIEWPIAVDSTGSFCDDLGVFKRPVSIVVDRVGNVRYAGLNARGLAPAVKGLIDEPYDESQRPLEPTAAEPPPAPTEFPVFTGDTGGADDFRGRRAPDFFVQHWMTPKPDPRGKVVVIDFWATWCKPCIQSIPHMNALADEFRDDVVIVGVAGEDSASFNRGMQKLRQRGITLKSFRYPIAMDAQMVMKDKIDSDTIPYCLVISADWIVRWQGHPAHLNKEVLGRIAAANRDAQRASEPTRPRRWGTS
jgi:thiol-disulfide isomerase/thioredoxin